MRSLLAVGWVLVVSAACQRTPAELWIEPAKIVTLESKGRTVPLKAQTRDDKHVFIAWVTPQWKSSDETVASVSSDGVVEARSSGKFEITATHDALSITVPGQVKILGSIEIEPKGPLTMRMWTTQKFTAVVKDDRGNPLPGETVRWASATSEFDVEQDGTVSAEASGKGEVIAKVKNIESRVKVDVPDPTRAEIARHERSQK